MSPATHPAATRLTFTDAKGRRRLMGASAGFAVAALTVGAVAAPAQAAPMKRQPQVLSVSGPDSVPLNSDVQFEVQFPGQGLPDHDEWSYTWSEDGASRRSGSWGEKMRVYLRADVPGPHVFTVTYGKHTVEKTINVTWDDPATGFAIGGRSEVSDPNGAWDAQSQWLKCPEDTAVGRDCEVFLQVGGDYTTLVGRPIIDNRLVLNDGTTVPVDVEASKAAATAFQGAYVEGYQEGDCSIRVFGIYHLPAGTYPTGILLRTSPNDPGTLMSFIPEGFTPTSGLSLPDTPGQITADIALD